MRILISEDQKLIGAALEKGLKEEGYAVDWMDNLTDGLHLAKEIEYDTVILDIMLPDGSGLDVLTNIRGLYIHTPVLVLSAKDALADKVAAFRLGTDDYMTKPFEFEELLLRVGALIRRKYQVYGHQIEYQNLKLDLSARVAKIDGEILKLTSKEYAVLELFLLKRTKILSRYKIAEHIYPESGDQGSNVID
ncbi:MAG: response regulator transcription factor, partial [Proteobacteria bacterium]